MIRKNTLQYVLRSVRFAGVKSWNNISDDIRKSPPVFIFVVTQISYILYKIPGLDISNPYIYQTTQQLLIQFLAKGLPSPRLVYLLRGLLVKKFQTYKFPTNHFTYRYLCSYFVVVVIR